MFTRVPSDYQPSARRRPLTIALVAVVAVYLVLTALGTLWTDFLWFDSVGYASVWQKKWAVSLALGAAGIVVSFLVLWLGLRLVDRLSPRWAPFDLSEEEELVERFREWVEPRLRLVRLWLTAGLAVILGVTVAAWRDEVFLFVNATSFGRADPIFNLDIGFYVFQLPLLQDALDWLFNLLVLSTLIIVIAHYFNGGIRLAGRRLTATRSAKVHFSVMLAVVALVRAAIYRLDMYGLLFSTRVNFFGPGYTDVNARLPAYRLLILVAIVAAVLFIVNIWREGWTLTLVAVGSWIVVAVAAGAIYPFFIQRISVDPQALNLETEYIEHNLEFTKAAWGIDTVEVRDFAATDDLDADAIATNQLTIDNLRLWDTSVLPRTYQNFQELRPYYTLSVVDTDRYLNDAGVPTQVMLAVRELEELSLPRSDWQNERLFYTHGVGAVVNEANVVGSGGQPEFLLQDVPPVASVDSLELEEPEFRVYFGETYQPGRPVIVKTGDAPQEIDIPTVGGDTQANEYDGDAGVVLDSFWKKLAFAFRYRDLNLLISPEVRPDSRVLVERNIRRMVEDVAPFLYSDTDPYPVIVDGQILWVVDMYTTSNSYPYSQPLTNAAVGRLARSSDLRAGINYMRNSVKAVINAYQGDLTLYLTDPSDPVARTWSKVFPDLFADPEGLPEGLIEHLRYPQDLFRVQGQLYLEYHVDGTTELFQGNDAWSLATDQSTISRDNTAGQELLWGDVIEQGSIRYSEDLLPYYLLTKLPGEADLSYLLLQPFTPKDKRNMSGFLVADSTEGRYGRLVDFRMPQGELVDGTGQAGQRIEQDAEIAQQLSLWRGRGSDVIKGDLLVVPVEESLIYIQPIFLEEEGGSFPEFRRVAVVYGDQVEWADTLEGAFGLVFGASDGGEVEPPPSIDGGTVAELLDQAAAAFAAADEALSLGDLAEYQRQIEEANRLIEEARAIIAGEAEASQGGTG